METRQLWLAGFFHVQQKGGKVCSTPTEGAAVEHMYTFMYISRLVMRDENESDKAWRKRKRTARISYYKNERRRFRACQARGISYTPHGLDFIDQHVRFAR